MAENTDALKSSMPAEREIKPKLSTLEQQDV